MTAERAGIPEEATARSAQDTEDLGRQLGRALGPEDVVYLSGDLGAGKTCFARGLAGGVGAAGREVASPTFAIVNEYADPDGQIVLRHVDLYRVPDRPRDLEALGIPDTLAGVPAAIEWPGESMRMLLPATVEVSIDRRPDEARTIRIRWTSET